MKYKIFCEGEVGSIGEVEKIVEKMSKFSLVISFSPRLEEKELEECYKVLKKNPGIKYSAKRLLKEILRGEYDIVKTFKKEKISHLHQQLGRYLREKKGVEVEYKSNRPVFWYKL